MSDNIETVPVKTPQQIASEKREKRIAELKNLTGRTFRRKDGSGPVIRVLGYGGIRIRPVLDVNGQPSSETDGCLIVEAQDARWNPPATKFLEEHVEIEDETKSEKIELI
jgi:hypothetical protein